MIENKIQHLTEIGKTDKIDKRGKPIYEYQCSCGNKVLSIRNSVLTGNKTNCGCLKLSKFPKLGQKYGNLIVVQIKEFINDKNKTIRRVVCECSCGKVIEVKLGKLRSGDLKSCGCFYKSLQPSKIKIGEKIGNFIYLGETDKRTTDRTKIGIYQCVCGQIKEIADTLIRQGKQISCGCSRLTECNLGDKFNYLTLIKMVETKSLIKNAIFLCDCGKYTRKNLSRVVKGLTKHCGCLTPKRDPLLPKLRKFKETTIFSKLVYERDHYTCVKCKIKGGYLNAHHLDGYHWCVEKRDDINNGVTLCKKCHREFHSIYTTKNNTKEQFQEYMEGK